MQVIDTASNTVTFTINLGNVLPNTLTVTPDGSTLYVAQFEGTRLWVINTATRKITKKLTVSSPQGLAVRPDGKDLYVCNSAGTVPIIDTATNTITKNIQISHKPWDVAFTPDGSKAYVAGKPNRDPLGTNHGYIAVVDTVTRKVVTSILLTTGKGLPSVNAPIEVMAPNGNLFYSQQTSIPVVSTSSNQVVQTLAQNFSHLAAAITPDGNFLYMPAAVGGSTLNEVAMIDSASGSVVGTQISLSVPEAVAIAPNGQFAYIIAENGQWSVYGVDITSS